MEQLYFRKAQSVDQPRIAEFNRAMALETEGKRLIHSVSSAGVAGLMANEQCGFYWVAERANHLENVPHQVIASLLVTYEWSDWRNGLFWWIQSVYVDPQFRGRGVYPSMYEALGELAKEDPLFCGFRLYVDAQNHKAQRTYERLGMKPDNYIIYESLRPGVQFLESTPSRSN